MSHDFIPPVTDVYNQNLGGVFGEFGAGANTKICYLQTTLSPTELNKISLISEIPGSETWSVRDLFQRDVDVERVKNGLLKYFNDSDKAKFFNPLTLALIPIEADSRVVSEIPELVIEEETVGEHPSLIYESEGLYRFEQLNKLAKYTTLKWNEKRIKVVAIDGQHRLSALKHHERDTANLSDKDFLQWSIPVVIIAVRKLDRNASSATVTDVIRNLFVYINSTAQKINDCRQILLSDESVNAICTQELLEYSHANDNLELGERDETKTPLLLFDWRGQERDGKPIQSEASFISIQELHDWLDRYLLGEDFGPHQRLGLGIAPDNEEGLWQIFETEKVRPNNNRKLRHAFRESVLPGFMYFMENFLPIKAYITALREIEREYMEKSDDARHAFHELRFGSNNGLDQSQDAIRLVKKDIESQIKLVKKNILPSLLRVDVGRRAVICAFGTLYEQYTWSNEEASWLDYAKWFTEQLNKIYEDGWFKSATETTKSSLLRHLCFDQFDAIVNYKLDATYSAFGSLMTLLAVRHGSVALGEEISQKLTDECFEEIQGTLLRGYKKEHRPSLKEEYPLGGIPLNKAVALAAAESVEEHLDELQQELAFIS